MICVSIGRGRHRHVIAEHKHLAEQGAQLVELRLDYLNGQVNLQRVLGDRPTPVIVPPVPTPETKTSTFPFVSFQISGPVVRK